MDTPLIRTLSIAPLVLQIFQLKVGRPCNADATQISFLNAASSMVQCTLMKGLTFGEDLH